MSKFYKILSKNGTSPYKDFPWFLPTLNEKGEWIPGEWVEISRNRPLIKCAWGLHAATPESLLYWYTDGTGPNLEVYELEFEGDFLDDSGYDAKPVGYKARLLRKLSALTPSQARECQLFLIRSMIAADKTKNKLYQNLNERILEAISGDIDTYKLQGLVSELNNTKSRSNKRYYQLWWYACVLNRIRWSDFSIRRISEDKVQSQLSIFFTKFLEQISA